LGFIFAVVQSIVESFVELKIDHLLTLNPDRADEDYSSMESDLTGSEPHQPEVPKEENGVDIPSLISRVKSSPPAQMKV